MDNVQDTIFGGFAPNSGRQKVLSKLSRQQNGSVRLGESNAKIISEPANDGRPLMTARTS